MSIQVKKNDNVLVLAGKDKGKTGKIMAVNTSNGRVVVDNVNTITKHNKPRSAQAPGGITKTAGSIDASNVQVICPSCGKATRIGHKEVDGKKTRVCLKANCGASLDVKVKVEKKVKKSKKAEEKTAETAEVKSETVDKPKKTVKKAEKAPKAEKAVSEKVETPKED